MMLLHEEPNLGLVEEMFQIGRIKEQRSANFFPKRLAIIIGL